MNVTVGDLLKEEKDELGLELIAGEKSLGRKITVSDLNRPGLALIGSQDHFRPERIQIIGNGEQSFCMKAPQKALQGALSAMLAHPQLPCLILTHNLKAPPILVQACRKSGVPLLRSRLDTALLVGDLSAFLEERLAPRTVIHGVLVEVYGLGLLIQGEPGIGKSECALELLKRGHILVADDAIEVQHRRGGVLWGMCPEPLRHYIEVRGLGIIDVKQLFGVGAILDRVPVELAVQLEPWDAQAKYDRSGLESLNTSIVGIRIPLIRIAVSPGRNLAILIEVAALNQRLRGQGYFAAETFNRRLIEKMRAAPRGGKPGA
ncbi:MAG: HPr(Ser) kinase/phosphatase [Elusimicrobia bacterium]|nr:HPr(Ser) kinase/phosphatase [Elusimicrobiota bacterium]